MATELPGTMDGPAPANGNGKHPRKTGMLALTVGAIGVVYGDIGTSPLYAFREAVLAAVDHTGPITTPAVLGVLSLIIWSLLITVTLKYVLFLIRADNNAFQHSGIRSLEFT